MRPLLPAVLPAFLLATLAATRAGASPAICAAYDLRLVLMVEFAGEYRTVEPEILLATVERMVAARRLCREGRLGEALDLYDKADLGGPTALLQ